VVGAGGGDRERFKFRWRSTPGAAHLHKINLSSDFRLLSDLTPHNPQARNCRVEMRASATCLQRSKDGGHLA
jgi:hypothetical protein